MNKEILSLETAQKLARYELAVKYLNNKIKETENKAKFRPKAEEVPILHIEDLFEKKVCEKILDILEVKNGEIK